VIYHELSDALGIVPQPPADATYALAAHVLAVMQQAGENDDLIERTDNGLRPDDEQFEQPDQDPGVRY